MIAYSLLRVRNLKQSLPIELGRLIIKEVMLMITIGSIFTGVVVILSLCALVGASLWSLVDLYKRK